MKRRHIAILAALALPAALAARAAWAGTPTPDATAALHQLRAKSDGPVRIGRHDGSTRIRSLQGRLSPPGEGSPEAVAGRFLREQAALFGLKAADADLALESVRESPGGTRLSYRQTSGDLPVFNGGVEVTLDDEQRVFLVNSEYVQTDGVDPSPSLDAAAAVAAAASTAATTTLSGEPQLGVFLDGDTPCLAWRFVLETRSPFSVVEYTVDAREGSILERRDLVQNIYKDGLGRVFNPNPVNTLKNTALKDGADVDGALFTPAYRKLKLRSLKYNATTGLYLLQGPHVRVTDAKESPLLFPTTNGIISSKTGNFLFGRTPDQFEHVMVYYYIDTNQRYIQALGFQNVNRRPILVDPHGLAGVNSSHYVANPVGKGFLAYGTGGVDDAEDADVILHEYAHAIQDNQAPGKYLGTTSEAAAMGEGFADYWAASSTYDLSVASGFDPACVGEWNKAPGCMDRVDSAKRYADKVGNAQADGQIWSAALWDLFKATGDRGATDSIVLRSHFLVPASPNFKDGADALLAADELLFAGAHQGAICSVMSARGVPTSGCEFSATVTWDNALVDLDLRLRPPDGASTTGWYYANDCASGNPNPDWGGAGDVSDDPVLKSDCRFNCTEEQIVLKKFTTPGSYGVFVHAYGQSGFPPQTTMAEVKIYKGGALVFSGTQTLSCTSNNPDTGTLWKPYTVEVAP